MCILEQQPKEVIKSFNNRESQGWEEPISKIKYKESTMLECIYIEEEKIRSYPSHGPPHCNIYYIMHI